MPNKQHLGPYSRGYLPHFDAANQVQMITFRLHDSLPVAKLEALRNELECLPEAQRKSERGRQIDALLDSGFGECWLARPAIAALIEGALRFFDGKRYKLLAWVIMPNHVHCIVHIWPGFQLGKVVQSWKAYTAREANRILGRSGPFWQREYYDTLIQDENHLENAAKYIHYNPVRAGLAVNERSWAHSSIHMYERESGPGTRDHRAEPD